MGRPVVRDAPPHPATYSTKPKPIKKKVPRAFRNSIGEYVTSLPPAIDPTIPLDTKKVIETTAPPASLASSVTARLVERFRAGLAEETLEGIFAAGLTLEQFCEDKRLCNIPLSDPQRALVRTIDGRPLDGILPPDRCLFHFGCEEAAFDNYERPRVVI